jgi:hypothetical protein
MLLLAGTWKGLLTILLHPRARRGMLRWLFVFGIAVLLDSLGILSWPVNDIRRRGLTGWSRRLL